MAVNYGFSGSFAKELTEFLDEKHTLGYSYRDHERILLHFDRMSSNYDCGKGLSKELALAFTHKKPHWKKTTQEAHISCLNQFARYLVRHNISAYIQNGAAFTDSQEYFVPYIFTKEELNAIFERIDNAKPIRKASYDIVYPVLFRILYGCGLRISEVLALNVCDVDIQNATLRILDSKNHKDRIVPMSEGLGARVEKYLREFRFLAKDTDPLFPSNIGRYTQTTIYHFFRNILWECGISHGGRGNGPRLHDLRHTFAVHSLRQFEQNDADMMAALPLLSAYLGHNTLSETGKYLRLTAECYPEIRQRMDDRYGNLFPEVLR